MCVVCGFLYLSLSVEVCSVKWTLFAVGRMFALAVVARRWSVAGLCVVFFMAIGASWFAVYAGGVCVSCGVAVFALKYGWSRGGGSYLVCLVV